MPLAFVPWTHTGSSTVAGPPAPRSHNLAIRDLEVAVDLFLEVGLAENSKKVYQASWQKYLAFSHSFTLPPTPITQENVTLFVAFLSTEGMACSTIKSYLATLHFARLRTDPMAANVYVHVCSH